MSAFLIPGEGCSPAHPDPIISSGLFLAHLRHLQQLLQVPALMQQWHYWCFILLYYNLMGTISAKKVKIHNVAIPHYAQHPQRAPAIASAPAEMAPVKPCSASPSPPPLFSCSWDHLHSNTPAQQKSPWVLPLCSGRRRGEKHSGQLAVLRMQSAGQSKNLYFPHLYYLLPVGSVQNETLEWPLQST